MPIVTNQMDRNRDVLFNSNIKLPDTLKGKFVPFYQNANWFWHESVCYFQYLQWHGGAKKEQNKVVAQGSTTISALGCENGYVINKSNIDNEERTN